MMVWTEPLPKERVPRTMARRCVLQRAGDDFGRRGRAAVDQHDDRQAVRDVARLGVVALGLVVLAAAGRDDLAASRKASDTAMAWSSRPPGLLRRSMM
jgi:hypothetical protein